MDTREQKSQKIYQDGKVSLVLPLSQSEMNMNLIFVNGAKDESGALHKSLNN